MNDDASAFRAVALRVLARIDRGWTEERFVIEAVREAVNHGLLSPRAYERGVVSISQDLRQHLQSMFTASQLGVSPGIEDACEVLTQLQGRIDLRNFVRVGRWVTSDTRFRERANRIQTETQGWLRTPDVGNMAYLVCGDSGAGKTFFVSELLSSIDPPLPFKAVTLSTGMGSSAAAWQFIETAAMSTAGGGTAKIGLLIDEVDTRVGNWCVFDQIYQYTRGVPEAHLHCPPHLTNVLWFFTASCASSRSSFELFCKSLEPNSKALDFMSRLNGVLEIPSPAMSARERVVRACSIIKQKQPRIEEIEGMSLLYFAASAVRNTREMAILVEKSLVRLSPHSRVFTWDCLDLPLHSKLSFVQFVAATDPTITTSVFRIGV